MIHLTKCPVCNNGMLARTNELGATYDTVAIVNSMELPARIVASYSTCLVCGTVFQNPRMDDGSIDKFYSSGTYRIITGGDTDGDEKRRAEYIARLIKEHVPGEHNTHVDIGCSRGYLLTEMGCVVKIGIEPNKEFVTEQVDLLKSELSDLRLNGVVDLVTIIHVLEHVPYPVQMLKDVLPLMRPEGKIVLEVPSDVSPGGWPRLPHLYHFRPWALHRVAQEAGLEITHMAFTPHLFAIMKRKNDS